MLSLLLGTLAAAQAEDAAAGTGAAQPVPATLLLFSSPDCEDCHAVKDWWAQNPETTGSAVLVILDVEQAAVFNLLLQIEKALGVKQATAAFPAMYAAGRLVYGREGILAALPQALVAKPPAAPLFPELGRIAAKVADATTSIVELPVTELTDAAPAPAATPATMATGSSCYLAFFHQPGCRKCSRQELVLRHVEKQLPGLVLKRYDITTAEGRAAFEKVRPVFKLSDDARSHVPLLVFPDAVSADWGLAPDGIVARLKPVPQAPPWMSVTARDLDTATVRAHSLFERMTMPVIISAGLIDGINPCAFATAVFLVGYLTYLGRGRRDILLLGGSFCVGVFLTYFLIGLGLSQVVHWLAEYPWIKTGLYACLGAFGVVLGVLHGRDAFLYRRGGAKAMHMGLSLATHQKIHEYVRQYASSKALIASGLLLGLLISSLELACTGQIYFPTLVLINRMGTTGRSLMALLIYNVSFLVPLLIVTAVAASGVSSKVLVEKAKNSVFGTKLAMSVLFFALGAMMVWLAVRG